MPSTVTFTGADDGTVRVRDGDRVYRLNKPVEGVPQADVKRLESLPGLHFKVTDSDSSAKGDK